MKALTTRLVERAQSKQTEPPSLDVWRDAAQAQIDEPVIDAMLFSRPGSYGTQKAASSAGMLPRMLLRKHQEVKAGGLPQHFILAVTGENVVALERKLSARGELTGQPGPEVARWHRQDLEVTSKVSGYQLQVDMRSAQEDERVQCKIVKTEIGEDFVRLLSDPARTERAAG